MDNDNDISISSKFLRELLILTLNSHDSHVFLCWELNIMAECIQSLVLFLGRTRVGQIYAARTLCKPVELSRPRLTAANSAAT